MSAKHMPILNAAIEAELIPQSICGWHKKYFPAEPVPVLKAGNPNLLSHGLCDRCKAIFSGEMVLPAHQQMLDEILADETKLAQIEALPAPIERLAKPQELASQYQVTTNRNEKQIVASRKQEPKFYGAIEI